MVRVLTGTGVARLEFAPRPEFGQVSDQARSRSGTGCSCSAPTSRSRCSPRASTGRCSTTAATTRPALVVDLAAHGGSVAIELRFGSENVRPHPTSLAERQARAEQPWSRVGGDACSCRPRARRTVLRSALTLRGLCHEPTGSILAAATTSLPEELGGVRNWDYRYCWLRDAAMSARVLVDLGSLSEAEAFLRWVDSCVEPHRRTSRAAAPALHDRRPRARRPRPSSTRCPATRARDRCASATPPTARFSSTSSARSPI